MMNCCDDYGNCTQGLNCPIHKERMINIKERSLFWDVMEGMVILCAIIGTIAALCFSFGYFWYTP